MVVNVGRDPIDTSLFCLLYVWLTVGRAFRFRATVVRTLLVLLIALQTPYIRLRFDKQSILCLIISVIEFQTLPQTLFSEEQNSFHTRSKSTEYYYILFRS